MTPTDASERERLIAALHTAGIVSIDDQYRAADMLRADAEKIRALEAALVVLAEIPIEAFGKEAKPEYPLMGWDGHLLKVEHVLAARAALAATQSPRSKAGGVPEVMSPNEYPLYWQNIDD